MTKTEPVEVLPEEVWREREAAHRNRLAFYSDGYRKRRSLGKSHPVHDFLFQYYPFSPGKLLAWSPGVGSALELGDREFPGQFERAPYHREGDKVFLRGEAIDERLRERIAWMASLLGAVEKRPPVLGCYGLHEWAMVYGLASDDVRHSSQPLRLDPEELRAFVDSQRLCCTHYDAFRFFTPEAVPKNSLQPTIDSRIDLEQPGCIHTNIDLYRWAYKLSPWIPGELLGDCFLFAIGAREIDMRASPYDLEGLGYEPIRIETPEGREEYRREQQALSERGAPLRKRLRKAAEGLLK